MNTITKSILFLQADYSQIEHSKYCAFWNHFGLADAFQNTGYKVTICRINEWNRLGPEIIKSDDFDICIVNDLAHGIGDEYHQLNKDSISMIRKCVEVMIGITAESIYGYRNLEGKSPDFANKRQNAIGQCAELFDGFILSDFNDRDEELFLNRPCVELVPFICNNVLTEIHHVTSELSDNYAFIGSINEHRLGFLHGLKLPHNFKHFKLVNEDKMFWQPYKELADKISSESFINLQSYYTAIRSLTAIRRSAYAYYLSVLGQFKGFVNIPTHTKVLHPRFVEASLFGVVSIMPTIFQHFSCIPQITPNVHYLPFDIKHPQSLCDALYFLDFNSDYRKLVSSNARLYANEFLNEKEQLSRLISFVNNLHSPILHKTSLDQPNLTVKYDLSAKIRKSDSFFLPKYYKSRVEPKYFEDILSDTGFVWQPDVYDLAGDLALLLGAQSIIDIGSGTGEKLMKLGKAVGLNTIGVDYGRNVRGSMQRYPEGKWIEKDLEEDDIFGNFDVGRSVIIHSDVIEHLRDPSNVLDSLRTKAQLALAIVISTPDRDTVRGLRDFGPPSNPSHVREWSLVEFSNLVYSYGLSPVFCGRTRNNTVDNAWSTILAVFSRFDLPLFRDSRLGYSLRGSRGSFFTSKY